MNFYQVPQAFPSKYKQYQKEDINFELRQQIQYYDKIDSLYGYDLLTKPGVYQGYLINTRETQIIQDITPISALDCYFVTEKRNFRVQIPYRPYVLIQIPEQNYQVLEYIQQHFSAATEQTVREDSKFPNHVAGQRSIFYKIVFPNRQLLGRFVYLFKQPEQLAILRENEVVQSDRQMVSCVAKLAEFDVADSVRTQIDLHINCGTWYDVVLNSNVVELQKLEDQPLAPRIRCLAYDIETSKAPLCFPNAQNGDAIMCISYMLDGFGVLLVNRAIFSRNIEDFEYSPTHEMTGKFRVFNCQSEKQMLLMFFQQIKTARPHIIVTYNGDQFDFKFIDERCILLGLSLQDEIGFRQFQSKSRFGQDELQYLSRPCIHIDCFRWVKRDSYLPQGSQGLKAVCREKLKYQPMELDPEDMTPFAKQKPQVLAQYSVSDAVATFYLYHQFIHSFILALCTIIPLSPDFVLRKGTGTLCETLLMVKASEVSLLYPDKISAEAMKIIDIQAGADEEALLQEALKVNPSCVNALDQKFTQLQIKDLGNTRYNVQQQRMRRLLKSQTYVGGRVEAIHAGIYRKDIETDFAIRDDSQCGYETLIQRLDSDLLYWVYDGNRAAIEKIQREQRFEVKEFFPLLATKKYVGDTYENYDDVRDQIRNTLIQLKMKSAKPYKQYPMIVHLDVSAMYPNIILTNRLQPHAVVDDEKCGTCDYNFVENKCKRNMAWTWRGTYYPCKRDEIQMLQQNMMRNNKQYANLQESEKQEILQEQIEKYCQSVYHKRTEEVERIRMATICERENPFYVDTVKAFRDLRYVYKGKQKEHSNKYRAICQQLDGGQYCNDYEKHQLQQKASEEKALILLNESLQLAHKAILNSFYGYAMRASSRWFSLEMAACVTFIGAAIIKNARALVEKVGSPLELDTDGIWCMLPSTFPNVFELRNRNPNKRNFKFDYPTVMLNSMTAKLFCNNQYQRRLSDELHSEDFHSFAISTECSIKFELDGPYKAMFLSAAKEEGKQIKKRYAVFDDRGDISELKGFELKRRGELQLVKSFQQRIFKRFLNGQSTEQCYESAAVIARQYYSIITQQGRGFDNSYLEFLLQEQTTMKNSLEKSKGKKGTAITCAKRLAQAIDPIFAAVDSLTCVFVISRFPLQTPVSERAIPVLIFSTASEKQQKYIRLWTGQNTVHLSDILDWEYYGDRFRNCLYRIIVIPAGLQLIPTSPIPEIPYPDWLQKFAKKSDNRQITDITDFLVENDESKYRQNEISESEQLNDEQAEQYGATVDSIFVKYNIDTSRIFDFEELEKAQQSKKKYDRDEDYIAWIERQKQKWHALLTFNNINTPIRQLQRKLSGKKVHKIKSNDIISQLNLQREQDVIVLSLQVENDNLNAILYNLNQHCLQLASIDVPQLFYINTRQEFKTNLVKAAIEKCYKKLPRNQQVFNLYEVQMDRQAFQQQKESIQQVRNSPQVDNIYELQVNQADRLILELGNSLTVASSGISNIHRRLPVTYTDLAKRQQIKKQYILGNFEQQLLNIAFYTHLSTIQGDIGILLAKGHSIIYSSCSSEVISDEQLINLTFEKLKKLVSAGETHVQYSQKLIEYLGVFSNQSAIQRVGKGSNFMSFVQKQFLDLSDGPTLIFGSSNDQFEPLQVNQQMLSVFSSVTPNQSISENLYELILKFLELDNYSTISGVPFANLANTKSLYKKSVPVQLAVCDYIYGQKLRENNFVLWWNRNNSPDLGKDVNILSTASFCQELIFQHPGHYQGYSVNFGFKYAIAEVIQQLGSTFCPVEQPGSEQTKQLHYLIQFFVSSPFSSELCNYLDQYIQEQQSLLFDDIHSRLIVEKLHEYLHALYNFCYATDIVPVCISQKQIILSTNKVQEHLTTNQLQIYIRKLQQENLLKIAQLEYNFCYKQLLYLDYSNFYALTITQTLNKRTYLDQLLPKSLTDSLEHIIACFLTICSQIEGVSLLQVANLEKQPNYFFDNYRLKQLDLVPNEQLQLFRTAPLSYLSNIANVLDLSRSYHVPEKIKIAIHSPPVSIYLNALQSFLSLNASINQKVKILFDSLFTITQTPDVQILDNLFVQLYCPKCGDFYQINISRYFNDKLQCDLCGTEFQNSDVEEKLVQQFQNAMDNGFREQILIYEKVGLMRNYQILLGCVSEWKK